MVDFTAEQIDRAVRLLKHLPGAAQKAMARAMNRALEGARTTAVKMARRRYNVNSAAIKATIKLRRATPAQLSAEVLSVGRKLNLFAFGTTPNRAGTGGRLPGVGATRPPLRVAVLRGKRPGPIGGAFVAPVGGKLVVARRKGKARMPILKLSGPAIPQMIGVESVIAEVERVALKRLDARLAHEIDRALEGGR